MDHWVRDARYSFTVWNSTAYTYMLYHFLRVMGWKWLWECDGTLGNDPNHCDDGNMEEAGVAKWSAVGTGVPTKVATPLHSGLQTLEIASSALNDGVRSDPILSVVSDLTYRVAIWAYNDTGSSWEVEADIGGGTFASIGSIPDNGGVWTLYQFTFTADSGVGIRYIRIIDNNTTTSSIYADAINVWVSYYEYNSTDALPEGTDGVVTNPDQFSSGSYSFVAGDVGKFIAVRDTANLGNTGVWAIISTAAGVATLELRSATAALTSTVGLTWRMFDISQAPVDLIGTDLPAARAGFGLESPHSSKWRLFVRQQMKANQTGKWITIWSSPQDQEFDFSSGNFWRTGPSVQNPRMVDYDLATLTDQYGTRSSYLVSGTVRVFMKTDDDGSYLAVCCINDADPLARSYYVIGYTGADADHPGIEEFAHCSRWSSSATIREMSWTDLEQVSMGRPAVFGPDGLAHIASSDNMASRASGNSGWTGLMVNAGPNPWSGKEWLRRTRIIRDPLGEEGYPSERDTNIGLYQGRSNMPTLSTFDGDDYLHIQDGVVWNWMGESL